MYVVRQLELKTTVMNAARARNDNYGRDLIERIEHVDDLVAADGQYHIKCFKGLYGRPKVEEPKRRGPFVVEIDRAMEYVYDYLENSDDECQFSMDELMEQMTGSYKPDVKTVKARLKEKYGDDILLTSNKNKKPVVCFRNIGEKIITDTWYKQRCKSEREERLRIVQSAAKIICEDVRSQVYERNEYPPPDRFLEEIEAVIPETLSFFLETLIVHRKKKDNWKTKCTAIAHSVISILRPRSFLSSVQVGLGAFIYKKTGSRKVLEVLNSMGFCCTYKESVRFEISSAMQVPKEKNQEGFSQFIFDNADFNTQTIDGHNTFHVMGGMYAVSPAKAVPSDSSIPRLKDTPSASTIGSFGAVVLQHFEASNNGEGLKAIKIKDLSDNFTTSQNVTLRTAEILWLYSKHKDFTGLPGWNVFMQQVTADLSYQKSFTAYLPFILAPTTDYDTIYTALLKASDKCKAQGQTMCMVTFDQPLYLKARYITANSTDSRLKNVVPRLGGFHLLMSFLGSIGYIMDGSGLKDLFNTVYAMNSIEKMMTGHAYYRAIRAHLLAHAVLMKFVMEKSELSPETEAELDNILYALDKSVILASNPDECVEIKEKVYKTLHQLKERGATAELWVQYIEMVTLVKMFILAERMGKWDLHLEIVWCMLPYFHASGHFAYAKCSQLYLQDMLNLTQTMPVEEFDKFTTEGFFTIRRTSKFWCGTWTDMAIEQFLMKNMKLQGGLTHGRGVGEGVLTRWTMGMTSVQHVSEQIENFCGVSLSSSEQHVALKDSAVKRDKKDGTKMYEWLQQHLPFPENPSLYSLSTGVVADERVTCHKAKELGVKSMNSIVGGDFGNVKFKRSDRVQPLAVMRSAIKIDNHMVPVNPTTLFQRISVAKHSNEELEDFLSYDLGPYSLSLFDQGCMRKGTKSTLYKGLKPLTSSLLVKCNT